MQYDAGTNTFANTPGVNTSIFDFGGQFCAPIPYEPLFAVAQAIGYTSGATCLLRQKAHANIIQAAVPLSDKFTSCMTLLRLAKHLQVMLDTHCLQSACTYLTEDVRLNQIPL